MNDRNRERRKLYFSTLLAIAAFAVAAEPTSVGVTSTYPDLTISAAGCNLAANAAMAASTRFMWDLLESRETLERLQEACPPDFSFAGVHPTHGWAALQKMIPLASEQVDDDYVKLLYSNYVRRQGNHMFYDKVSLSRLYYTLLIITMYFRLGK